MALHRDETRRCECVVRTCQCVFGLFSFIRHSYVTGIRVCALWGTTPHIQYTVTHQPIGCRWNFAHIVPSLFNNTLNHCCDDDV